MNSVQLVGRLGNDPELRYTQAGKSVSNFRIATNEFYGGNKYTEWHRIVVWGKTAENCAQYLSKGRQVLVQGRIQTRQWEDREGTRRYTTEIIAQRVEFLGGGKGQNMSQKQETKAEEVPEASIEPELSEEAKLLLGIETQSVADEDVPF